MAMSHWLSTTIPLSAGHARHFVKDNRSQPSRRNVEQHPFAQAQIADSHTVLPQPVHDRPDDDRPGGDDFFAVSCRPTIAIGTNRR